MSKSWIDKLQEATAGAETPRSFIYWSAIATIAAVANNGVYLNRRDPETKKIIYRLSPNVFIMLIAESGLGKGLPVVLAKKFVQKVGKTRVISGRNSIQGIIQELSRSETKEGQTSPILKDARGFLVSGEFHNLMIRDPEALTILTEWYDTHWSGDWKNTLKHSAVEELKNVNITLLGASSPEHFAETVPEVNIKGGFIGRTLMVFENKRWRINSLAALEDDDLEELEDLTCDADLLGHLIEIEKAAHGKFIWTQSGLDVFNPWYDEWRKREINDKTGTAHRMPDHVLKVAMCLALSRRTDLKLYGEEIQEAVDGCIACTVNTKRITGGTGKQQFSLPTKMVLDLLLKAKENRLSRQQLLNKGYGEFDANDLNRIEETLIERGIIEITRVDNKPYYTMTAEAVEQYTRWKAEEQ